MWSRKPGSLVAGPAGLGWTIETLAYHQDAMRAELDRRLMEVAQATAMALDIKSTADEKALQLAAESQLRRDTAAEVLRDKQLQQTGIFATNVDMIAAIGELKKSQEKVMNDLTSHLTPFLDWITSQQGASKKSDITWQKLIGVVSVLVVLYVGSKNGVKVL
jgi:hypothetical protein